MIKLFCNNCKSEWYTASDRGEQFCDNCGSVLELASLEDEMAELIKLAKDEIDKSDIKY